MPWPNPFGTSAAGGGKNEVTFGGPILLGKIKEGGVAGIGPLISPSGALLVQSTGALTNQVVSTGAPTKAAFLYAPVSTASLITAGPPPYTGYGAATVFVNNTTDQHWEVWSTQDNEWIRFGQVSTVGSGGGSTMTINGRWPEIAVYTSPGGNLGGYEDLTWTETDNIFLVGISTSQALFGGASTHQLNTYLIGNNNAQVTSSAGFLSSNFNYGYNYALGNANLFTNATDSQIVGEGSEINGASQATIIGNFNGIGPKTASEMYIMGQSNLINSSQGTVQIYGFDNLNEGSQSIIIGAEAHLSTGALNNLFFSIGAATTGSASTQAYGNYSTETNAITMSVADVKAFLAIPGDRTVIYNQSSSGTAWGVAKVAITSSAAQVDLGAASTADQNGPVLGVYSAGSAGSTGAATVRLYQTGATGVTPFRFYESTVGNYVGLVAPTTMPNASFNITLPTSAGSTGMVPIVTAAGPVLKFDYLSTYSGTFVTATAGTATVVRGIITQIV